MKVESCAKINLGLHVLSRRADNFHNIVTIFQEISFSDQLTIEQSKKTSGQLKSKVNIQDFSIDSYEKFLSK